MASISRRGLLGKAAIVGGSILLATSKEALAATVAVPAALGKVGGKDYLPVFEHQPISLPFDPKELEGISEKVVVSHYQNEYVGAVNRLNSIQQSIAKLPPQTPAHLLGALKREELAAHNSMILHDFYFQNIGGSGRIEGEIEKLIAKCFGRFDTWKHNFKLAGQSLSGGSGWVVLAYSSRDGRIYNVCSPDHTVNLSAGAPLLVMDMYEHSYQIDHGANAAGYIDAFLANVNWTVVNKRLSEAKA